MHANIVRTTDHGPPLLIASSSAHTGIPRDILEGTSSTTLAPPQNTSSAGILQRDEPDKEEHIAHPTCKETRDRGYNDFISQWTYYTYYNQIHILWSIMPLFSKNAITKIIESVAPQHRASQTKNSRQFTEGVTSYIHLDPNDYWSSHSPIQMIRLAR